MLSLSHWKCLLYIHFIKKFPLMSLDYAIMTVHWFIYTPTLVDHYFIPSLSTCFLLWWPCSIFHWKGKQPEGNLHVCRTTMTHLPSPCPSLFLPSITVDQMSLPLIRLVSPLGKQIITSWLLKDIAQSILYSLTQNDPFFPPVFNTCYNFPMLKTKNKPAAIVHIYLFLAQNSLTTLCGMILTFTLEFTSDRLLRPLLQGVDTCSPRPPMRAHKFY